MTNFTVMRNKLRKMMDGSSINIWDKRSEEEHRIAPGSAGSNILLTNNA